MEPLFSIIVPHRNTISLLPKLFSTIPDREDIEIILVDNSPKPITKQDIGIDRNTCPELSLSRACRREGYSLLYSAPSRGAGGARNVGIENARGKWLIFADADDYFTDDAFCTFLDHKDDNADVIYFCAEGIFIDTGERSNRCDFYSNLVKGYLMGSVEENKLKYRFGVPWAKMVRKDFIDKHNCRYDEVVASNDMYFSMQCGFYAKKIEAIDKVTYIATVSKGSLTRRRDKAVISSRYGVYLRFNKFLRQHNLSAYQYSVMYFIVESIKFGLPVTLKFISMLFKYGQNPFRGCSSWFKTMLEYRKNEKKEANYITK